MCGNLRANVVEAYISSIEGKDARFPVRDEDNDGIHRNSIVQVYPWQDNRYSHVLGDCRFECGPEDDKKRQQVLDLGTRLNAERLQAVEEEWNRKNRLSAASVAASVAEGGAL